MAENEKKTDAGESEDKKGEHFEKICGLTLAFLAAVLAVTDLGGGKFGGDEGIANINKANAYEWYNSKGLKKNLAEGQRDILVALVEAGSIASSQKAGIDRSIAKLSSNINRYGKEQREILLGSKAVGESNWVQDVDGKFGVVTGAKEYEKKADDLNAAGDTFDMATLFLQLSLVIGAISLMLKEPKLKWIMYAGMVVLGITGGIISGMAYSMALPYM